MDAPASPAGPSGQTSLSTSIAHPVPNCKQSFDIFLLFFGFFAFSFPFSGFRAGKESLGTYKRAFIDLFQIFQRLFKAGSHLPEKKSYNRTVFRKRHRNPFMDTVLPSSIYPYYKEKNRNRIRFFFFSFFRGGRISRGPRPILAIPNRKRKV